MYKYLTSPVNAYSSAAHPVLSPSQLSSTLRFALDSPASALSSLGPCIESSITMFSSTALLVGIFASLAIATPTPATVIVPGAGLRLASTVHQVPAGGSIAHMNESTVHVLDAAGALVKAVAHTPTKVKAAAKPVETGWVAYASWLNTGSSPISSFKTTWTVPAVPKTNHGQTVFLFNSIEPNSGNAILQPVLQYGPSAAGGGSYWAVASWYLVGDSTFHTTPVRTSAGATLNGVIRLISSSGSSYNYATSFSNIAGTSLTAKGAAQLTWATETLESYSVTATSDYPAGSTTFRGINLALANGAAPKVSWSTVSDSSDGISTQINTNGATNAAVTITY